jgi:DNA gyrase inhibitor GyrI
MHIELIELPAVRVASLRYTGAYGPALGVFWRDTFTPWLQQHHLDGPTCYGIGLDDPASTAPEQCRYDACVEVPEHFLATAPASVQSLPGGRYAVAGFCGNTRDIGLAWVEMCSRLLPESGLQHDTRPSFERYLPGARTDPVTGLFICQLCIAVR